MNRNLTYAPQPKVVDGLLAVPIDIRKIEAKMEFDLNLQVCNVDVSMQYATGKADGYPVFDLRQNIVSAWLDDAVIDPGNLAAHDFGGEAGSEMRIIEIMHTANTLHELRLVYQMGLPLANLNSTYPPAIQYSAGPRLLFNFGFTDLKAGRYLEAFLPANLIYDQFHLELEIELKNTAIDHQLLTNGTVSNLGLNHWAIDYPDYYTALSFLLELRASDTINTLTDTVILPVSGKNVSIEIWKLTGDSNNLQTQVNNIKNFLIANENSTGAYFHGNRFVAYISQGGMEYDGGTTSVPGVLGHEVFHSWWARGVKPARQQDGWFDEAWTVYHDTGFSSAVAFDFSDPPITLCSQNEWQRFTPQAAYNAGFDFWSGVAALLGVNNLKNWMSEFYQLNKGKVAATYDLESFLLCKSGNTQLVTAFHRFVYGFATPSPAPSIYIRDDVNDPGNNQWGGRFWDSPDIWVRNSDDDGSTHQNPEFGQDNYIYVRVNNKSNVVVEHFVVTLNVKEFAGTEFIYPQDFLPCTLAVVGFNLAANGQQILKVKWPKSMIPQTGTHPCILAGVLTPGDMPVNGLHVWEHNNLAQKNLTIVDLKLNFIFPFIASNRLFKLRKDFMIKAVVHDNKSKLNVHLFQTTRLSEKLSKASRYDCGCPILVETSKESIRKSAYTFTSLDNAINLSELAAEISIPYNEQRVFGIQLAPIELNAAKKPIYIDILQVERKSERIVGGISFSINP